jgi:hypothetical protein
MRDETEALKRRVILSLTIWVRMETVISDAVTVSQNVPGDERHWID